MVMERGLRHVHIETDAQQVVRLWDGNASILYEVREIVCNLSSFRFSFIERDANNAAHPCVKKASESRRRCLWLDYIPPFLADTLQQDCNQTV